MQMRHQNYSSFFERAEALGYYDLSSASKIMYEGSGKYDDSEGPWEEVKHLWERDLYLKPGGIKDFAALEQEDCFDVFVNGKYPVFNQLITPAHDDFGVWYMSYVKDGELYVVVMNRTPLSGFNQNSDGTYSLSGEVPLKSWDGLINIGDFTAVPAAVHAGHENDEPIVGNGSLKVEFKSQYDVLKYKIIPKETVDYSGLTTSIFYDLIDYPWLKKQVDELADNGMVNTLGGRLFRPERNIIRADFALFLMRSLGLTEDGAASSFNDVDAEAYYAKEVASGKRLDIFSGTGKNLFEPLAEITRQDAMVIIARALRAANKLDGGADLSALGKFFGRC